MNGRLRLLAQTLRMVAARAGVTFATELLDLHMLGTVDVRGSRMDVDGWLFLLSTPEPGLVMCDAQPYLDYRVEVTP